MKRFKRISLISSGIICALGILLMGISLLTVNFDVRALDLCGEPEKVVKEYSYTDVNCIRINIMDSGIELKQSNNDKIRITYYTTECCPQTIKNSNGKVTLCDDFSIWEYNIKQYTKGFFHRFKRIGLKTIVEIPKECTNLIINIDTNNSSISAENISAENIIVDTSNGSVFLSNIKINKNIITNSSNGRINIENINAENMSLNTSNGRIDLKNITSKQLKAYTSNGAVTASNINAEDVEFSTSNGKIEISNISSKNDFTSVTSNGSIILKNISSPHTLFDTSNGSISGNMLGKVGDYYIKSGTSNGNDSLAVYNNKNTDAPNILEAYTSNGNIDIIFDDN